MLDIRDFRHLIAIDEFRHFGRAARAVGLSQPALSKSLQRIEATLGTKLFDRSRAGVNPTPVCREVLARARRIVEEASELQRTAQSLAGACAGTVAVGIGPAMSESYVVDAIAATVRDVPNVQIIVRVDHWQQLAEWLLSGELAFYVADVGEGAIDPRFHHTGLPPQKFVWFCRKGHPLLKPEKRSVSRSDLLHFPLATPKLPPWAIEWFAAACGREGVAGLPRPFPAIECESYAMLKRFVASSDCYSAALEQTLADELHDGSLAVLPVDAPQPTTHAAIVQRSGKTPSPLAAELISRIAATAAGFQPPS